MATFKMFSRETDGSNVILVNVDHVISAEQGSVHGMTVLKLSVPLDGKTILPIGQPFEEVRKMLGAANAQGS